jgi:hypothetical protein
MNPSIDFLVSYVVFASINNDKLSSDELEMRVRLTILKSKLSPVEVNKTSAI